MILPGAYRRFLRENRAPLATGFLFAFLSGPGQTFFVALFVAAMADSLGVGVGVLGGLYMVATLGAALLLALAGQLIDRIDLRPYSAVAMLVLAAACFATAAATSLVGLVVALLFLRLAGQGLMIHIEATATARYFREGRGKALSLTAMGLPVAEAVLPVTAALLIGLIGWRYTYGAVGLAVLLVFLPVLQWLLARRPAYTLPAYRQPGAEGGGPAPRLRHGLALLARSRLFWLAIPLLVFMPCIGTALLFHIGPIAAARGWSLDLVASGFVAFAITHAAGLLIAGPLVDRFAARNLFGLLAVPMVAGMAAVALMDHWSALFVMLGMTGLTTGLSKTVNGALWAEAFGVRQLGAIRSAAVTLMVGGTAVGPALLGGLIDAGVSVPSALLGFSAAGVAVMALAALDRLPLRAG